MAYSRWTNSIWYTFWSNESCTLQFKLPTKKLKRCQKLNILYTGIYTISYGEIVDKGIYKLLEEIKIFYYHEDMEKHKLDELGGYMRIFIQDVDDHFSWFNFFRLEWIYPLKYSIFVKKGLTENK